MYLFCNFYSCRKSFATKQLFAGVNFVLRHFHHQLFVVVFSHIGECLASDFFRGQFLRLDRKGNHFYVVTESFTSDFFYSCRKRHFPKGNTICKGQVSDRFDIFAKNNRCQFPAAVEGFRTDGRYTASRFNCGQ